MNAFVTKTFNIAHTLMEKLKAFVTETFNIAHTLMEKLKAFCY